MSAFRHVLAPVGFSRLSEPELRLAASIAGPCGALLTAFHVHPYPSPGHPETPPLDAGLRAAQLDHLSHLLRPAQGPKPTHLVIREGDPAHEILTFIAESHVDLVVLGKSLTGGVGSLLAHSVSTHVAREAPCSVLLLGEDAVAAGARSRPLSEILCAVDFDPPSDDTLDLAFRLAAATHARLTLLHVASPSLHAPWPFSPPDPRALRREWTQRAQERIAQLVIEHAALRLRVHTLVEFGPVPETLAQTASSVGADLLIVGGRSRRILGHRFLGSVARDVSRQALCPVLLARPAAARWSEGQRSAARELIAKG